MTITLATLPQATEQEVFDQVATHLLSQNKKAMEARVPGGKLYCTYRTEDGLMCAAGCLMSDKEFAVLIATGQEGQGWRGLVEDYSVPEDHMRLICDLQALHDSAATDVEQWPRELKDVAKKYGLSFKENANQDT